MNTPAVSNTTSQASQANADRRRRGGAATDVLLSLSRAQAAAAAAGVTVRDLLPDPATRAAVSPLARDELSRLRRHAYLPV